MGFEDTFVQHCVGSIYKAICCLICLIVLGPCLFIIGISLLVTAPLDSSRETNIADTNNVILDWNNIHRAEFSNLVVYTSSTNSTSPVTLAADTKVDPGMDESELSHYTPLKYDGTGNFIQNQFFATDVNTVFSFWFNKNTTSPADAQVSARIFREFEDQNSDSQTCANDKGQFTPPNLCTLLYKMDKLCVKFSMNNAVWEADSTIGSNVGCDYSNGITAPGVSETFTPEHYVQTTDSVLNTFNNFQVIARSSSDPYVTVQLLTQGSGDFGLTKADRAVTGLVIMIIGIVFMIPCCGFCFLLFFCMNKHSDRSWHRGRF